VISVGVWQLLSRSRLRYFIAACSGGVYSSYKHRPLGIVVPAI